jgi:hypothetical protein
MLVGLGKGSYAITFIPSPIAALAVSTPILTQPNDTEGLAAKLGSGELRLSFLDLCVHLFGVGHLTQRIDPGKRLIDVPQSKPETDEHEFRNCVCVAPGVLKTHTPLALALSTVMLLTPAPARATASRPSKVSVSTCAERTTIASGFSTPSEIE